MYRTVTVPSSWSTMLVTTLPGPVTCTDHGAPPTCSARPFGSLFMSTKRADRPTDACLRPVPTASVVRGDAGGPSSRTVVHRSSISLRSCSLVELAYVALC